jgi:hypothetical protein
MAENDVCIGRVSIKEGVAVKQFARDLCSAIRDPQTPLLRQIKSLTRDIAYNRRSFVEGDVEVFILVGGEK